MLLNNIRFHTYNHNLVELTIGNIIAMMEHTKIDFNPAQLDYILSFISEDLSDMKFQKHTFTLIKVKNILKKLKLTP